MTSFLFMSSPKVLPEIQFTSTVFVQLSLGRRQHIWNNRCKQIRQEASVPHSVLLASITCEDMPKLRRSYRCRKVPGGTFFSQLELCFQAPLRSILTAYLVQPRVTTLSELAINCTNCGIVETGHTPDSCCLTLRQVPQGRMLPLLLAKSPSTFATLNFSLLISSTS